MLQKSSGMGEKKPEMNDTEDRFNRRLQRLRAEKILREGK